MDKLKALPGQLILLMDSRLSAAASVNDSAATEPSHMPPSAVVPLLFALLCFAIAGPALLAAFVTAHIWLVANVLLRLGAGHYVRATLWGGVLAALLALDCQLAASPADAHYALPQDYLDAAAAAVREPTPRRCELFMEQEGQSVHVVIKGCDAAPFDDRMQLTPKRKECGATHIDAVERTDETTYLVYTTNQSCVPKRETLMFQVVGGDTLRITNVESY